MAGPGAQPIAQTLRRLSPRRSRWIHVRSLRIGINVSPVRRVPDGLQRLRAGVAACARVIHGPCPVGAVSWLTAEPKAGERPYLVLRVCCPLT
jgi:hypothetical protein